MLAWAWNEWFFGVSASLGACVVWENRKRVFRFLGVGLAVIAVVLVFVANWLLQKEGGYCFPV